MNKVTTNHGAVISYAKIRTAATKPYDMDLVGAAARLVQAAVDQGVDSHLEACFVPARGDSYQRSARGRLVCVVSQESLPVLIRRLAEMPETQDVGDDGPTLANDILFTLGFDETGVFRGRKALGLE